MEANFRRALPLVLKHEGGFVNHPRDPGGATNKGITLANYRRYVKQDGSVDDLKAIRPDEVERVYKLFYWDAVKADLLPPGVDYAVFDFAVNSGPGRAIRFLQRVVGAVQDGAIGAATLAAVKATSHDRIINRLCDDRLSFLQGLSTWSTFGKGWGSRVAGVRAHALDMAHSASPTTPEPVVDPVPVPASAPEPAVVAARPAAPARPDVEENAASKNTRSGTAAGGAIAAFIAGIAAAATYFWNQIISLFGG
jgi:lysozyme family protein